MGNSSSAPEALGPAASSGHSKRSLGNPAAQSAGHRLRSGRKKSRGLDPGAWSQRRKGLPNAAAVDQVKALVDQVKDQVKAVNDSGQGLGSASCRRTSRCSLDRGSSMGAECAPRKAGGSQAGAQARPPGPSRCEASKKQPQVELQEDCRNLETKKNNGILTKSSQGSASLGLVSRSSSRSSTSSGVSVGSWKASRRGAGKRSGKVGNESPMLPCNAALAVPGSDVELRTAVQGKEESEAKEGGLPTAAQEIVGGTPRAPKPDGLGAEPLGLSREGSASKGGQGAQKGRASAKAGANEGCGGAGAPQGPKTSVDSGEVKASEKKQRSTQRGRIQEAIGDPAGERATGRAPLKGGPKTGGGTGKELKHTKEPAKACKGESKHPLKAPRAEPKDPEPTTSRAPRERHADALWDPWSVKWSRGSKDTSRTQPGKPQPRPQLKPSVSSCNESASSLTLVQAERSQPAGSGEWDAEIERAVSVTMGLQSRSGRGTREPKDPTVGATRAAAKKGAGKSKKSGGGEEAEGCEASTSGLGFGPTGALERRTGGAKQRRMRGGAERYSRQDRSREGGTEGGGFPWRNPNRLEEEALLELASLTAGARGFPAHAMTDADLLPLPPPASAGPYPPCEACLRLLAQSSAGLERETRLGSDSPGNSVPVISVLACGHVYHAECLDRLGRVLGETAPQDPACPRCFFNGMMTSKAMERYSFVGALGPLLPCLLESTTET